MEMKKNTTENTMQNATSTPKTETVHKAFGILTCLEVMKSKSDNYALACSSFGKAYGLLWTRHTTGTTSKTNRVFVKLLTRETLGHLAGAAPCHHRDETMRLIETLNF